MNILKQRPATILPAPRTALAANISHWNCASLARSRSLAVAKRRRERVLACLAFGMLLLAWDATLTLDERVSPPRVRVGHGVEGEAGSGVGVPAGGSLP